MATLTDKELEMVTTTYYSDRKDYTQFAEWAGIVWWLVDPNMGIYWKVNEQCWHIPDKALDKIRLLLSPHHHALLKAYEIIHGKD